MSIINIYNKNTPTITNETQANLSYDDSKQLKILDIVNLTTSTYILRLERKNISFKAGQHIALGRTKDDTRQYSIYSGENDNYIEVLVKEVEDGQVSKQLKKSCIGDYLYFEGPIGYFRLDKDNWQNKKYLFLASGTGIAPFRSFIRTYPNLDFKLIHSVRYAFEAYGKSEYDSNKYTLCTTRGDKGDYFGRLTEYLKDHPIDKDLQVYLCGNCDMIHAAYDILLEQGLPSEHLHSEVYF